MISIVTKRILYCLVFSLVGLLARGQGLINNGANIVFNSTATIYINGTTGHYKNQNSGLIKNNTTGGTLVVFGNWTNNASNVAFQNDGTTVNLSGADQTIGGTNSTSFYNLTLGGSGTKYLGVATNVGGQSTYTGVLSLGTRPLDLSGYRVNVTNTSTAAITYSTGYIISETNASVNTSIINWKTGTNTGTYIFPFGLSGTQIPVTFSITSAMASSTDNVSISTRATTSNNSPWAGASNVGAVATMRSNALGGDGSTAAVVDRWWDITPSASLTANVTFRYRGAENTLSNSYNTGNVGIQHWNGTSWDNIIGIASAVTSGVGSVSATGLTSFSPYVIVSTSAVLPVELLNFGYNCDTKGILFNWCTASETNSDHFTLSYSPDAVNFRPLTTIPAQGNSTKKNCYQYLLDNKELNNYFFRLSQTDHDGKTEFFDIIYADDCVIENDVINVYNTSSNELDITINAIKDNTYALHICNSIGQSLRTENLQVTTGNNTLQYNIVGLPPGIYFIQLINKEKSFTKKILIY
ncbi:MAG TPA: T9SS type A sorting domain-containing protein [Bacteroidia bacterium]|jgi:hypothetical protein|nr:T9SS type A sorting domain-containing protein [Bacteroidia bacterium]